MYYTLKFNNALRTHYKPSIHINEIQSGAAIIRHCKNSELKDKEFSDYLAEPCSMFSDRLKRLIDIYENHIAWTPVIICNTDTQKQIIYWILRLNELDCIRSTDNGPVMLCENIDFEKIINVKQFHELPRNQIEAAHRAKNSLLLFRLDLVESILRRNFYGLCFEPIANS